MVQVLDAAYLAEKDEADGTGGMPERSTNNAWKHYRYERFFLKCLLSVSYMS